MYTSDKPYTRRGRGIKRPTDVEQLERRARPDLTPSPPSLQWRYCAGVLDHSTRRAEDLSRTMETHTALFTHIFQHDERNGCAAAWTFPDCRWRHLNDPSQLKSKWCLEELRSVHIDRYIWCVMKGRGFIHLHFDGLNFAEMVDIGCFWS